MINPPSGQRKFWAFVLTLAAFTGVVVGGYVPGEDVVDGYFWITGLFFGSNVGEHISKIGRFNG